MNDVKMNRLCFVAVVIVLTIAIRDVCTCPSDVCICKWKGGKQSVECGDKFLADMPAGIDAGTQVLNFSGNNLQHLMSERFYKMGLINLQKIYLARNQLSRIHDRAFRGLSNLVELDLSDNVLPAIPSETFSDYTSLMRLILNGNAIRELKSNAFRYLSFLTTLELSNCQLSTIEDEAFLGLDNLEWLKLDGNLISTLQGNHILPQSLHGINMQGNRWQCDCNLIDLHAWLSNFNVPQIEDPKCVYPDKLAGSTIKHLKAGDLACAPQIMPATLFFELQEGRNISLSCKVTATPIASITWRFQNEILQNDTFTSQHLHLFYYIEDSEDDRHSELFIYNVSPEVNGTFSCYAENSAGNYMANYTIRVLVREEPIVEEVNFPYEYFIIIIVGAGIGAFIIVLVCCCIVLKCVRRTKRKRKCKNGGQDGNSVQSGQMKFTTSKPDAPTIYPILKNGNYTHSHKDMQLTIGPSASLLTHHGGAEIASVTGSQMVCSPPAMRTNQDQNPDLINDAESVNMRGRIDIDDAINNQAALGPMSLQGLNCDNSFHPSEKMLRNAAMKYNTLTLPQNINKDMYQHQVDVHLNPGCFLAQKAYPMPCYDFQGIQAATMMQSHLMNQPNNQVNYYRTLPHKPKPKMPANPGVRFSLEAEFLNQGSTIAFDTYNLRQDIRYTLDGYPKPLTAQELAIHGDQQFPSPPDGYKNDINQANAALLASNNATMMCAPMPQWPATLPGYNVAQIDPVISGATGDEQKRFVSTNLKLGSTKTKHISNGGNFENDVIHEEQNEDETDETECTGKLRQLTGPLADSPDEGYGGDASHDAITPDT